MSDDMKSKLRTYKRILLDKGWEVAEKYRESVGGEEFSKWCRAIAIFLRAEEIARERISMT